MALEKIVLYGFTMYPSILSTIVRTLKLSFECFALLLGSLSAVGHSVRGEAVAYALHERQIRRPVIAKFFFHNGSFAHFARIEARTIRPPLSSFAGEHN